jgi:hypothetical protein
MINCLTYYTIKYTLYAEDIVSLVFPARFCYRP